jgi:hypothetical protein
VGRHTAIVIAAAYARLLQALRPYPQRNWGRLEWFGWLTLAIAVSQFYALVGAHSHGRNELFVGLYLGGHGIDGPSGVVDFFWSKFARERAISPDAPSRRRHSSITPSTRGPLPTLSAGGGFA